MLYLNSKSCINCASKLDKKSLTNSEKAKMVEQPCQNPNSILNNEIWKKVVQPIVDYFFKRFI